MEVLTFIFFIAGVFMIADAISSVLRIILQAACSIVLGLGIAVYILSKLEAKN